MDINLTKLQETITASLTDVAFKILAALVFWVVGRWLIGVVQRMVRGALERQKVDPTLMRYVGSMIAVTLNIILVIGILGYFGSCA